MTQSEVGRNKELGKIVLELLQDLGITPRDIFPKEGTVLGSEEDSLVVSRSEFRFANFTINRSDNPIITLGIEVDPKDYHKIRNPLRCLFHKYVLQERSSDLAINFESKEDMDAYIQAKAEEMEDGNDEQ